MFPLNHPNVEGAGANKQTLKQSISATVGKLKGKVVSLAAPVARAGSDVAKAVSPKAARTAYNLAKRTPILKGAVTTVEKAVQDQQAAKNAKISGARKEIGKLINTGKEGTFDSKEVKSLLKQAGLSAKDIDTLKKMSQFVNNLKSDTLKNDWNPVFQAKTNPDANNVISYSGRNLQEISNAIGLTLDTLNAAQNAVLGEALNEMFKNLNNENPDAYNKLLWCQTQITLAGIGSMVESKDCEIIYGLLNDAAKALLSLRDLQSNHNNKGAIQKIDDFFKQLVTENKEHTENNLLGGIKEYTVTINPKYTVTINPIENLFSSLIQGLDKKDPLRQEAKQAFKNLQSSINTLHEKCTGAIDNQGQAPSSYQIDGIRLALSEVIEQTHATAKAMTDAIPKQVDEAKQTHMRNSLKVFLGAMGMVCSVAAAVVVGVLGTGGLAGIPLILAASTIAVGFGASTLFTGFSLFTDSGFNKLDLSKEKLERLKSSAASAESFLLNSAEAFAKFDPIAHLLKEVKEASKKDPENMNTELLNKIIDLLENNSQNPLHSPEDLFRMLADNHPQSLENILIAPKLLAKNANKILNFLNPRQLSQVLNFTPNIYNENYKNQSHAQFLSKLTPEAIAAFLLKEKQGGNKGEEFVQYFMKVQPYKRQALTTLTKAIENSDALKKNYQRSIQNFQSTYPIS
jgi:hypothetical protein